jgi:hypothetical protein
LKLEAAATFIVHAASSFLMIEMEEEKQNREEDGIAEGEEKMEKERVRERLNVLN